MTIQEFSYYINLLDVILWQYQNATILNSLVNAKNNWLALNNENFWNDWYTNVFNLQTANVFGLSVWSIILGLPLFVNLNIDPDDKPIWGFNEVISFPTFINGNFNFNNGNFSNRGAQTYELTVDEQRLVLRLRYFQLTTNGNINNINSFFAILFEPLGAAYVLDGLDMTITYVFNFNMSYNLRKVLYDFDLLPRPAGVLRKIIVNTGAIFGFNELVDFPEYININQNFNNGNFLFAF